MTRKRIIIGTINIKQFNGTKFFENRGKGIVLFNVNIFPKYKKEFNSTKHNKL